MAARKPRKVIQIRYHDDAIRQRWDETLERIGASTHVEALEKVLDAYDMAPAELTGATNATDFGALARMFQAEADLTGVPVDAVMRAGLAAYRDKFNSDGQGAQKIGGAVREIMKRNVAASEWFDRQAITASGIFTATGSNQGSIRKWLAEHAELVAAHHEEMGIDDPVTFNRRTAQHKR